MTPDRKVELMYKAMNWFVNFILFVIIAIIIGILLLIVFGITSLIMWLMG